MESAVRCPAVAQIALRGAGTSDGDEEKDVRERALPFARLLADVVESTRDLAGADPRLLVSVIVGPILYYVAALPTYLGPQADDLLAPERVAALRQAARQLGTERIAIECHGETGKACVGRDGSRTGGARNPTRIAP